MKKYAEMVGKGAFFIFTLSLMAAAIGYGFRIFLSRTLSIDEFGLFYSVLAFVAVVGIFRELGLATSLVKHISELRAKNDLAGIKSSVMAVFLTQLGLSVLIFTPIIFLAGTFAENYFGMGIAPAVLVIALVEAIINMGLYSAVFQGMQKFRAFAFIELSRVSVLFGLSLLLISSGVMGVVTAHLLTTIVMNIIFVAIALKGAPFLVTERFSFDRKLTGSLFRFGITLWLGNIVVMIVSRIDILFITYFRPLAEVAWYNVSLPTAMLLTMFSSAISSTLYPTVSELWAKGEKQMLSRGLHSVIKFFFVLMIPLAFIFIAFPDLLVTTLFGQQFAPAAFSLQLLSAGMLFSSMAHIFMGAINGIGRPDFTSKTVSVIAVINFLLNAALVPFYGLDGAALSTMVSFMIMFLATFLFLKKQVNIEMQLTEIIKMLAGGALALAVIWALKLLIVAEPVMEAVVTFSAAMVFYAAYMIYGKIIVKDDIAVLESAGLYMPARLKKLAASVLKE